MTDPVERALTALGDPTRRHLYERILARPSRPAFLAAAAGLSESAVRHHLRRLSAAKLIRDEAGLIVATTEVLPDLRTYFDRLWFEASVGEGWMRERFTVSRRMHWRGLDIGEPDANTVA